MSRIFVFVLPIKEVSGLALTRVSFSIKAIQIKVSLLMTIASSSSPPKPHYFQRRSKSDG